MKFLMTISVTMIAAALIVLLQLVWSQGVHAQSQNDGFGLQADGEMPFASHNPSEGQSRFDSVKWLTDTPHSDSHSATVDATGAAGPYPLLHSHAKWSERMTVATATLKAGAVSLGANTSVISVEVPVEDIEATSTYAGTVSRVETTLLTGELPSDDPPVNFRITAHAENGVSLAWDIPHNRGITGYDLERRDHDGTEYATSDWSVSGEVAGGDSVSESSSGLTSDSLYRYDLSLEGDDGTVIIEKSLEIRTLDAGTATLSADATLSALALSDVDLEPVLESSTYRYSGTVARDIARTTVTATLNDSSASYEIRLGGIVDQDGVMDLAPGRNVVTVRVIAADSVTTRIYTVVVHREKADNELSNDASLRALFLRGIDFGGFESGTTSYTAEVGNDVSETTVTPVLNDFQANHTISLGGVEDTDGNIDLAVGQNVIGVEVLAEDGTTVKTYTVTVMRAAPECVQPVEADATIEGTWDDTCLSEKEAPGGDGDRYARFYTFTLDEAADITLTLESDEDTYLYLLDGHGKDGDTLHENDDIAGGGANLNSQLSVSLQPGDYTIEATTYYAVRSGDFTLEIEGLSEEVEPVTEPDPEPEPETEACEKATTADGTIEGTWDDTCLSEKEAPGGDGDRYARFYTFTLDEAADITLTLESDEDTYLYLLGRSRQRRRHAARKRRHYGQWSKPQLTTFRQSAAR